MTRYAIDTGHNCSPDIGAVGVMDENVIVKQVGTLVMNKLINMGYKVTDCLPPAASSVNESLRLRCTFANRDNVDYFISIHANSGGGHGTEVWYKSDGGYKLGKPILDELVALGYKNRGMKQCGVDGPNFYVISNTNAPACLVELFFCDSEGDCTLYNAYNAENLSNAIVKGLTGKYPNQVSTSSNSAYRVITGTFNNKAEAQTFADKLKAQGTTAYVVDSNIMK